MPTVAVRSGVASRAVSSASGCARPTSAIRRRRPWRIEDVAKERGANYVQGGLFKPFVVRDGRLITGQQQYSGRKVAQLVIQTLGT
jgi:putative intracellular protease/amidase